MLSIKGLRHYEISMDAHTNLIVIFDLVTYNIHVGLGRLTKDPPQLDLKSGTLLRAWKIEKASICAMSAPCFDLISFYTRNSDHDHSL